MILKWLRKRKTEKFLKNLPPIVTKINEGRWVIEEFERLKGRKFNVYSYDDRHTIEMAMNIAMIRCLP